MATIVCLSLFLFYSVILTETRQVMHQMTLNCGLRCYEAALLGNQASGRHQPLVASVTAVKAEGRLGLLRLYLLFVGTRCPLAGHVSSAPSDPATSAPGPKPHLPKDVTTSASGPKPHLPPDPSHICLRTRPYLPQDPKPHLPQDPNYICPRTCRSYRGHF